MSPCLEKRAVNCTLLKCLLDVGVWSLPPTAHSHNMFGGGGLLTLAFIFMISCSTCGGKQETRPILSLHST